MASFAWLLSFIANAAALHCPSRAELYNQRPKMTYRRISICETTPGVRAYSGYVTLPPSLLQPFEQNLFWIFFEARREVAENAPLTLWLQGGPGQPSTHQAFGGHNGPCKVNPDSNSTTNNPWSWNNHVHMLYLDQPSQTGYSYDVLTPGRIDLLDGGISPNRIPPMLQDGDQVWLPGVFGSQNDLHMANTSANAADSVWRFLHAFMDEFPSYKRRNISLWSQSYGGHWVPAIATYFRIINGFVDAFIQLPLNPAFAVNNTYGIEAYSPEEAEERTRAYFEPDTGCQDLMLRCRDEVARLDPDATGRLMSEGCVVAILGCVSTAHDSFMGTGLNGEDITQRRSTQFPEPYSLGYLNRKWVQDHLGAMVNYTTGGRKHGWVFFLTGDLLRSDFIKQLGVLLDDGVPVTLVYGDRDYKCNWYGGEAVSLALEYGKKGEFAKAGYADLVVNDTYTGGKTRQHGILSFTRVYQAGHEAPYYQPETVYQIFMRATLHNDIATGEFAVPADSSYTTTGPATVYDVKNTVPPEVPTFCYATEVFGEDNGCTEEQWAALREGTAEINNFIVTSPA